MTAKEYLGRHFSRVGARVRVHEPGVRPGAPPAGKIRPAMHHLVLMVRDGNDRNKFLLGRDEGHWFAAALPNQGVRDVRTAMASLRPAEIEGRKAIRQGEWFFVAERDASDEGAMIHRKEPLSRGAGSKPHMCSELMRRGGVTVTPHDAGRGSVCAWRSAPSRS